MGEKIENKKLQMTCTRDEFSVVKTVSVMSGFDTISDYLRSLVTSDIIAKKKAHKHPEIYGISTHEWDNLSEGEREQYLNQIAPVKPQSIDYWLKQQPGQADRKVPLHKNDLGL